MVTVTDGLRPCPFCGGKPRMWKWNGGIRIDCSNWNAKHSAEHYVGIGGKTEEEVIRKWNGLRAVLDSEGVVDSEVNQTLLSPAT